MEVEIREQAEGRTKVIISCKVVTKHIQRLQAYIENYDEKLRAKKDNEVIFVDISEVLYFEAVDNRTYLYTKDQVMEMTHRLYELEEMLPSEDFIRCSKSVIVNINRIKSLRPQLNRTILVTMCNGEKLSISRRFVKAFKDLLEL